METPMSIQQFQFTAVFIASLHACAYPLNGEWEGIERQVIVDGAVSEKFSIPYEECYPSFDPETQELIEGTSTCIERGFSMHIDGANEIIFEASNSLNEGQEILLSTLSYIEDIHILTDGSHFEISCVLDTSTKEKLLYCDFTNTLGYLNSSRIVFSKD